MPQSCGLLLFRRHPQLEVLLGHMGGPYWARREAGAWTIPKGEPDPGEEPLAAAMREFSEETGGSVPPGAELLELGEVTQRSGKVVHAWAAEGEFDPEHLSSNTFEMEWPAGSGRRQSFPEIDRVAWFAVAEAQDLIIPAQAELLERLEKALGDADPGLIGPPPKRGA